MSVSELKLEIINRLNSIEDKMILQEIYNLLKEGSDQDTFYALSSEEKKAIEAGLNDIQNGNVYTSERANDLILERNSV